MYLNLDAVELGNKCTLVAISGEGRLKERLGDFGLVPGTVLRPVYRSPGRHGTVIEFRGTQLALRTKDLGSIRVRI